MPESHRLAAAISGGVVRARWASSDRKSVPSVRAWGDDVSGCKGPVTEGFLYAVSVAYFRVGDRVANSERPCVVGTITAIVSDDPAGAAYEVDWEVPATEILPSEVDERLLMRPDDRRR